MREGDSRGAEVGAGEHFTWWGGSRPNNFPTRYVRARGERVWMSSGASTYVETVAWPATGRWMWYI
jgi:hypothetical protein